MSDYGDPGSFDPYHLLNVYLPDEASIESRVVLTAAIRNPDYARRDITEFADVSPQTTTSALHSFYRGTVEYKALGAPRSDYVDVADRTSIGDYTTKQQAVIEFFARYPAVRDACESDDPTDWTWSDALAYVADQTGIGMTPQYFASVARDHWGFITEYRDTIDDVDELPDIPEKPGDIPGTVREILESQISPDALPDGNLDEEFVNGEEDWIEPYADVDLKAAEEADLPHHGRNVESAAAEAIAAAVESDAEPDRDEDRVRISAGSTSYSGPAAGIDTTSGEGTQTIDEAPAYAGSDENAAGEADADATVCMDCGRVDTLPAGADCPGELCSELCSGTMEPVGDGPEPEDDVTTDGETKCIVADVPIDLYEELETAWEASDARSPGQELVRRALRGTDARRAVPPTDTPAADAADARAILAAQRRIEDAINLANAERKRSAADATAARLSALEWAYDVIDDESPSQDREPFPGR